MGDGVKKKRIEWIDTLRGITIISMIVFHGMWDAVYMYGFDFPWYESYGAYIWQQSICWTFILLAGFCWKFDKHPVKRGLLIFGAGILVSVVSYFVSEDALILFGILTAMGSFILIFTLMDKLLCKVNPVAGLVVSFALFMLLKKVPSGYLGFGSCQFVKLPDFLYANYFTAYLGFPQASFRSSDYFPVLPWIFLFQTGYFIKQGYDRIKHKEKNNSKQISKLFSSIFAPLRFLGRHSLLIYLLHQPLLVVAFEGLMLLRR